GLSSNGVSAGSTPATTADLKEQNAPAPGAAPGTDADREYRPGVTPSILNVPSAATGDERPPTDTVIPPGDGADVRRTVTRERSGGGGSVDPTKATRPDTLIP